MPAPAAVVVLHWLPLGAGGHSVRVNGKAFEWLAARHAGRARRDLYHSALEIRLGDARFVVEMTPAGRRPWERGVVAGGTVGVRPGIVRYEVRCWLGGGIPDVAEAVGGPRCVTTDPSAARRVLELGPRVPTPVWGRDELATGEMWNSNSIVSWLVESAGLDAGSIGLPEGGRAPGWDAGIVVAQRT
jgi:hypothetical protein